jgi:hypothetical protein
MKLQARKTTMRLCSATAVSGLRNGFPSKLRLERGSRIHGVQSIRRLVRGFRCAETTKAGSAQNGEAALIIAMTLLQALLLQRRASSIAFVATCRDTELHADRKRMRQG